MTDFHRINEPRVEKIMQMLDTIDKSARSNKADAAPLLEPVRLRLNKTVPTGANKFRSYLLPGMPGWDASAPAQPMSGKSHWSDVIEMARTAPLSDCVAAVSVIMNRIEEELTDD